MGKEEFISFYKQNLNLDESDQQKLFSCLQEPLPYAFRVVNRFLYEKLVKKIEEFKIVRKIEYFKGTYEVDKKLLEENNLFREFLIAETDAGNIQRQEIVSMIPVYCANVKSTDTVLETCAAPGSKTKQILENNPSLLVSNDVNSLRIKTLISEATKTPNDNFIVIKHDATRLPIKSKFSKVFVDVPCSSDGTIRKNIQVLEKWNINIAKGLINTQFKILSKAATLCNDTLIYSTCSLNPLENEFVVNKLLQEENFELVSINLPMKTREGLTEFNYEKYSFKNDELRKCLRIMPHDNQTGGFFVAIFKRKIPLILDNLKESNLVFERNSLKKIDLGNNYNLFTFGKAERILFAIGNKSYEFLLTNPSLKLSYIGVKAYQTNKLGKNQPYRPTSTFVSYKDFKSDLTVDKNTLINLLETNFLEYKLEEKFYEKLLVVQYENLKFSCFAGINKLFLYVNKIHRKSLLFHLKNYHAKEKSL